MTDPDTASELTESTVEIGLQRRFFERTSTRYAVVAFLSVAVVLVLWVWASASLLQRQPLYPVPDTPFPGSAVLEGWFRFDGGWYKFIAENGYSFTDVSQQSPVAFFPGYPMTMRAVDLVVGNPILSGILITFTCGLGAVVLFTQWTRETFDDTTARTALWVLLLYPYAWFLFGAVYGDALFLLATIAAFVLLERDKPVLAGLAGAVATATRPVGVAVIIGLVVLTASRGGPIRRRRELQARDAGVLLSVGGLAGWSIYLWSRFGDPLLFWKAEEGWGQGAGPHTWFKVTFFQHLRHLPFWLSDALAGTNTHDPHPWTQATFTLGVMLQGTILLGALVLLPRVVRKLGWGYGAYVATLLFIPLFGTQDFQGVGRYVLAAFPVFAVFGQLLTRWSRWRIAWLSGSAALLLLLSSGYARGYYVG